MMFVRQIYYCLVFKSKTRGKGKHRIDINTNQEIHMYNTRAATTYDELHGGAARLGVYRKKACHLEIFKIEIVNELSE